MGIFIRILFFAFIAYYLIKFISKFLLSRFFRNIETDVNRNNSMFNKKEGEVTVQSRNNINNKTKDIGEYVDFEEIEPED